VHGPITFESAALALIGTPEFQRLWGIRQTGFAHLVFPGANHTRLEHSLGAYWVAEQMSARLGLADDESHRVALGALLHDLGHGPFSHSLDAPMVEVLGRPHEALSRERIEGTDPDWPTDTIEIPRVLERFGYEPHSVANLIDPGHPGREPRLLRAILHGAIDADRIDYLQRDAYYTGVAHGAIDAVRLLDTMRPVRGHILFAEKGRSAVEGFLVGRALMYSSVYFHKTVRAAEMMAQAAVERLPDYPASARGLFRVTDGELLVRLREAGGLSEALARGLVERRLYKRAYGWRVVSGASRTRWRRFLAAPPERRALEDELAARVGAPPGSVLIDLVGLEARSAPEEDWAEVGLLAGERATYPFRGASPWQTLASRPPADWAVSVYAARQYASAVTRALGRDRSPIP
jgi:HD superfamily phosphohydrolase